MLIVPIGRYTAQRVHTIDGIDDSPPFLCPSAMVFGKHALPFTYLGLRCVHSLTHVLPIGFKESRHVRFQPTIFGSHLDLANLPLLSGKTSCVREDAISQETKLVNFDHGRTEHEHAAASNTCTIQLSKIPFHQLRFTVREQPFAIKSRLGKISQNGKAIRCDSVCLKPVQKFIVWISVSLEYPNQFFGRRFFRSNPLSRAHLLIPISGLHSVLSRSITPGM